MSIDADGQPSRAEAPLSRRELRKQKNRDTIMSAAIELFEAQGCDATTLEEICVRAGVSRPTFYSYYPSKQELIKALVEKLWLRVANEFTQGFLQQANESTATCDYIDAFFTLTETQFNQYTRLERELIRQSMAEETSASTNMNMLTQMTGMFAAVYQRGRQRGDVTERYSIDFLAEMSMGVISTLMTKWAVDESYPLADRLREARQFIIDFSHG